MNIEIKHMAEFNNFPNFFFVPVIEKELLDAVCKNDLIAVKGILAREKVKQSCNLGRSNWIQSPLLEAARFGRRDIVRALVEAGVDVNSFMIDAENRWRLTALHKAVYTEDVETVKLLLELGADVKLLGHDGNAFSGSALDWVRQEHDPRDRKWGVGRAEIQHLLEEKVDGRGLRTIIRMVESKNDTAETLSKALDIKASIERKELEIQALDTKKAKLVEDVAKLKADADFRSGEAIRKLQDELNDVDKLVSAVQISWGPMNKSECNKFCPVCTELPEQIFSCLECEGWICIKCQNQLVHCPSCRQDFQKRSPRRNRGIEKALGIFSAE